ncbi:MAG TPA: chorismate synthase [Pyrinomonadaceae bacterium]|nr:chorismate synthase [Pyrinomonadaceae bacterium]
MFFRFTTAGESHGKALVAVVEGLPAGLAIDIAAINHELWRRQQGYGRGGRMKIETDEVQVLSGVRHGKALGSPVALMIENRDFVHWTDIMSAEAIETEPNNPRIVTRPRPGHADLAGGQKYGARDLRNILERSSARETTSRVAVGAIAKQLLSEFGIEIRSHVVKLGSIPETPLDKTWDEICSIASDSPLSCADASTQAAMIQLIDATKENGDTLGGIFEVVARGVVIGLGSSFAWNEKLDGRIGQAFMSIHAVKAVEIGDGVKNAGRPGSEVHDEIFPNAEPLANADGGTRNAESEIPTSADSANDTLPGTGTNSAFRVPQSALTGSTFRRRTNRAGGLEGGITNGEEIRVRGYLKPISTLKKPLRSVDINTKEASEAAYERSDVTVVPAAGVIGESMLAIVLANAMREKFGGDSIEEMKQNVGDYQRQVAEY